MAIYEVLNVGANKPIHIYGTDLVGTSLNDNGRVAIWEHTGSGEQYWAISSTSGKGFVRSYLNRNYGLNAYRNGTEKYKCDIHTIEGNEKDAEVSISPTIGGYRIKLNNYNMFLTADGTTNGSAVSWAPLDTDSKMQLWKLNRKSVITYGSATTLYGPIGNSTTGALTQTQKEKNATYIYDYLRDAGFTKSAACAALGNFERESHLNPAVWETPGVTTGRNSGYGIAQWTPSSYLLDWLTDVGFIEAATADEIDDAARNSVQKLMDAELAFLIWSATLSGNYFYNYSFETFKNSNGSVKELAKIFAQNYERPDASEYTERQNNAQKWYNYF